MTIEAFNIETWQLMLLGGLVVFELVLKSFALWRAARNNQPGWFIVLIVINSAGILPIVYLLMNKSRTAAN